MRLLVRVIVILAIFFLVVPAHAGGDTGWKFKIFGITINDFKDRDVLPVIIGGLTSFVVHEAGHYAAGELVGMDARFGSDMIVYVDEYDNKSDNEKALFHAGGFISQAIVGTILTAVPYTRHSDFSLGFTGFTFAENTLYGITDGVRGDDVSDTQNLDEYGYPGQEFALATGLYSGVLTYINLDKHDDSLYIPVE